MMKKQIPLSIFLAVLTVATGKGRAQVYTEANIATMVSPITQGWDMRDNSAYWGYTFHSFQSGFNNRNIIETNILIDDDYVNGKPASASPLYRLNDDATQGYQVMGGEFFFQCTNNPTQCAANLNSGAAFFKQNNYSSTANPRAYAKIDYYLPAGAAANPAVNVYCFPINSWNVQTTANTAPFTKVISLPNIDISKIADISVTILSDPVNGKVKIDDFDRKGHKVVPDVNLLRGGNFLVTPNGTGSQVTLAIRNGAGGGANPRVFGNASYSGSGLRGWVKVTYYGTAAGVSAPYAMKSKFKQIGAWPIYTDATHTQVDKIIPFDFGIAGSRVIHSEATIHTDPFTPGDPNDEHNVTNLRKADDWTFSHRHQAGLHTIDEAANQIHLVAYDDPSSPGYWASNHASTTLNRGWFRIDYLAGSCADGASGFQIRAVPANTSNNCAAGVGGNMVVQGAGADIWGTNDEFTYVYKAYTDNSNHTFVAKIVSQGNIDPWAKTGIMIRMGLGANSRHVSMLATPGQGVQWTNRPTDGAATVHPTVTAATVKAPVYLRLIKTATTYTGSYSTDNGVTWIAMSPAVTIATGATYYVGIAGTSFGKPQMNTTVASNFSGF
ncbi:MAG: type sorting protein [Fibrobacteres bacterium]|nr:type sorting protein [Fibrobacterota bacterium]